MLMETQNIKLPYFPPQAEEIEINTEGIICSSGDSMSPGSGSW